MLQVISGMYFRDVPLYEYEHRRTLFTNAYFVGRKPIDLGVATLSPSSAFTPVTTVWASLTERLEAKQLNGEDEFMLSTGGDEIFDDLAAVLSFSFNATFSTRHETVRRLVFELNNRSDRGGSTNVLLRTFDRSLAIQPAEEEDAQVFIGKLLRLNRPVYEQALRALKRIVEAGQRAADDPTSSYTDYVAALESLSAGFDPPGMDWTRLDSRARKILDPAIAELEGRSIAPVRAAILEAQRAGAKHRFIEFVLDHVEPKLFREDVLGALRPITRPALRRALSRAYDIRSESVHSLRELLREAWHSPDGALTVKPPQDRLLLTHEGLNRLSQHVLRNFVARGSNAVDRTYDYREHLPNVIQVEFAPQLFIGEPGSMTAASADRRFADFVSVLVETLSGRKEQLQVDMRPVLERVEQVLLGRVPADARRSMLAIYYLWHRIAHSGLHRPAPEETILQAVEVLQPPSVTSFAVAVLLDLDPGWSIDEWCELAEDRYADLQSSNPKPMPPEIDAALWISVAAQLEQVAAHKEALAAVTRAIDVLPGKPVLLAAEQQVAAGGKIEVDVRSLVLLQADAHLTPAP
ncbi:hypothetical protein [Kribbella sp. NPDC051770]|uniref:hypothetical protein n=1 Tax=Kribbella sp. NPDC051770 TaxID=3155413 RepID=UPI00342C6BFD